VLIDSGLAAAGMRHRACPAPRSRCRAGVLGGVTAGAVILSNGV